MLDWVRRRGCRRDSSIVWSLGDICKRLYETRQWQDLYDQTGYKGVTVRVQNTANSSECKADENLRRDQELGHIGRERETAAFPGAYSGRAGGRIFLDVLRKMSALPARKHSQSVECGLFHV